jgi:hypothetical protein
MKPKKQNKQHDILFILVSSFIVVAAWIAFNIYHIYITSTISQEIQAQLTPISPVFDNATIQKLQKRESIVPQFSIPVSSPSPSPTPLIPLPSAPPPQSPSPQPSVIPPSTSPIDLPGQ